MNAGVLLFAYNNDQIDYVKLAEWSANRINQFLNLPVTLVTDSPIENSVFDKIILTDTPASSERFFSDLNQNVSWKNGNRSDAFALTPYDDTLVLDVDYVVNSSDLTQLFYSSEDFLAPCTAYDVTGINDFSELNTFGKFNMPSLWATVLFFRKTHTAELLFSAVNMIKANWQHYRDLYQISKSNFRNDFAFAIAANLVFGQQASWPSVAWKLASVCPGDVITQITETKFKVNYTTPSNRPRYIEIADMDFHAMGKRSLGDIVANSC